MAITPQQAYEAAKVLWPNLGTMHKFNRDSWHFNFEGRASIDWGDTEQYPPPTEEWVDAKFPEDHLKPCRFADKDDVWFDGVLCGRTAEGYFMSRHGACYYRCQVKKVAS